MLKESVHLTGQTFPLKDLKSKLEQSDCIETQQSPEVHCYPIVPPISSKLSNSLSGPKRKH